MRNPSSQADRTVLRRVLNEQFNESELTDLCFELGVDYENLPGRSKSDKARELVTWFERRRRLADLATAIWQARPDALAPPDATTGGTGGTSQRNINTGGGDYAEGNIDKRQGTFYEGGVHHHGGSGPSPAPAGDEKQQKQALIRQHERRLHVLQLQAAQFGISCPPHITLEIEDVRQEIARLQREIEPG